ncbi:hypothetical protein CKAH01_12552 [Colletotrichum kahawae]|uniref:Uncharacterized protein n=1 Tax=Colletotrichum kahawae TaxID=34407 RepID=A0AAD9YS69_COLKA|nr:hypothetical protein CKAH01_12552 [Colletotrichum kahawae]
MLYYALLSDASSPIRERQRDADVADSIAECSGNHYPKMHDDIGHNKRPPSNDKGPITAFVSQQHAAKWIHAWGSCNAGDKNPGLMRSTINPRTNPMLVGDADPYPVGDMASDMKMASSNSGLARPTRTHV